MLLKVEGIETRFTLISCSFFQVVGNVASARMERMFMCKK